MTKMTISDLEFVEDSPSAQHKLRGGGVTPPTPPKLTILVGVAVQPFVGVQIAFVGLSGVLAATSSGVAAAGGVAASLNGTSVLQLGIGTSA